MAEPLGWPMPSSSPASCWMMPRSLIAAISSRARSAFLSASSGSTTPGSANTFPLLRVQRGGCCMMAPPLSHFLRTPAEMVSASFSRCFTRSMSRWDIAFPMANFFWNACSREQGVVSRVLTSVNPASWAGDAAARLAGSPFVRGMWFRGLPALLLRQRHEPPALARRPRACHQTSSAAVHPHSTFWQRCLTLRTHQ